MKNKKIFAVLCMCVLCCLLCGCGRPSKDNSFLENVPDPEVFFEGSDFSRYEFDQPHMKGILITYTGKDIKKMYSDYIKGCEGTGIWIHPVYDGDTSWCYQNEDRTLQIGVNLYEDDQKIDVFIKSISND